MSVYRHKKSGRWVYDFVIAGARYVGPRKGEIASNEELTKAKCEKLERARRANVEAGKAARDAGDWLLIDAAERWFSERGGLGESASDVRRRVDVMVACIGPRTRLRSIDGAKVSDAIQRRRGMLTRAKRPPSNATVNRDIIAPLRATLRRARRVWGATGMPEIDWAELVMPEPKGVVREYSDAQVEAWVRECGPDAGFALSILLTYGLRFGELFFRPADLDPIGGRLTLRDRKADDDHVIPLLPDDAIELGRRSAIALAKNYDAIWFDDVGPFSYWSLHWRIRSSGEKVGIAGGRLIHGARHHAATRIARASGNLAVAKQLLGHASIISTARYAHALEGDVRDALEALSRANPQTGTAPRKKGEV
jgi:hypothetical protein